MSVQGQKAHGRTSLRWKFEYRCAKLNLLFKETSTNEAEPQMVPSLAPHPLTLEGCSLALVSCGHSSGSPQPNPTLCCFHNNSAMAFVAACFSTNQWTPDKFLNLIFLQTMSYVLHVVYTWSISQVQLKLDHPWHLFT